MHRGPTHWKYSYSTEGVDSGPHPHLYNKSAGKENILQVRSEYTPCAAPYALTKYVSVALNNANKQLLSLLPDFICIKTTYGM